ncbi:hypothetical protein [Streptomyces mirabilis]|uniref:hypothetical protein n=1 Tax=Streptomyces mirabilis TaxID=68239 RepID=UPI003722F885
MSQQQPNQPEWATPQQDPEPGTPRPKKKRSVGKLLGLWCLGALGLFVVLGIIGSVTGSGKKTSSASDAKPSATASTSPPVSKPAKAVVAKPSKASKPSTTAKTGGGSTSPKPAAAQARKKAAAILEKEDQDFRDFLAEGEPKIGTPQYTAWYDKAVVGLDMQQNAFTKADAYFTADNEPTDLLEAWRADNGDGNAAITQFSSDGLSPDAPDAATRKDKADCLAALAKADKDAEKIANGS